MSDLEPVPSPSQPLPQEASAPIGPGPGTMIEIRSLCARYGGHQVLDHLHLDIHDKELIALMGAPKAGRHTLLRCLTSPNDGSSPLQRKGRIRMHGQELIGLQADEEGFRRRFVWIKGDGPALPGTIYDYLASWAPAPLRAAGEAALSAYVAGLLEQVGLAPVLDRPAQEIRFDQLDICGQVLVELARVQAVKPELVIADLRLSSDPSPLRGAMIAALKRCSAERAVILVSDNAQLVAQLADRLVVMADGRVVEDGPAGPLLAAPSAWTQMALRMRLPHILRPRH